MSRPEIETYRDRTRKLWSLRAAPRGLVFDHAPAVALAGCRFVTAETSRLRCIRTGERDVHAFVRGHRTDAPMPADAVPVGYRLDQPGFRRRDTGEIVTAAAAVWFLEDGSCFASL